MSNQLRSYTPAFKQEAVSYALTTTSVAQAAKDLGIPDATLYSWVEKAKQLGEVPNPNNGEAVNVKQLIDENQALKKRLAKLEQEKAILKKAATYFAKELG